MSYSKTAKVAFKQINLFTSSGAVVHPTYSRNPQFFKKLSLQFFTKINFSLVKNIYIGFNEAEFLEKSVEKFNDLQKFISSENKTRAITATSQPLLNFIISCQEKKYILPFSISQKFNSAKIVNVGKYSKDLEKGNSASKWYQIGVLLSCSGKDSAGSQYVVFERREIDNGTDQDWKIAHIDATHINEA